MTGLALLETSLARRSGRSEAASPEPPEVIMDVSGLLSRWRQSTPTGVDRVEMAYAEALASRAQDRLSFAGLYPGGGYARFPNAAVFDYLAVTREAWARGESEGSARLRRRHMLRAMLGARPTFDVPAGRRRVYLHLSPRGLERQDFYAAALRRERARLVAFVHDLIPIEYPEFVSDGAAARFGRKLETVARLADGVLVNSRATADALAPHLAGAGREIALRVAPLGARLDAPPAVPPPTKPYFVVLGSIEPRKNHLLLLHIWRRWVEQEGAGATPGLVIIGRRGWENENILDLLDRSAALAQVVDERNGLGDDATRVLMRGARAVLSPSFAEGYGLPVAEALGLGVPVLASDIAAHREVGGGAPDYLDPLDGPAWTAALRDYARPNSDRRRRQLDRLTGRRGSNWADHFKIAFDLIDEAAR
jgi:glycosyltransferase involved in cell wall biosynthesis